MAVKEKDNLMAQLWRVREGKEPTGAGSRWRVLPLDICVQRLGLTKADFVKPAPQEGVLPAGPTFGQTDSRDALAGVREPTILVVEVENEEGNAHGWRAGYYLAPLSLADAAKRLT